METEGLNSTKGYYIKWYHRDSSSIAETFYVPCNLIIASHSTVEHNTRTIVPGMVYKQNELSKWVAEWCIEAYLPFVTKGSNLKYKSDRSIRDSISTNNLERFVRLEGHIKRSKVSSIHDILRHFEWMLETLKNNAIDEPKCFTILDTREIMLYSESEEQYVLPV